MYASEDTVPPRRRRTASFSSSLLDAICRSIDDSKSDDLHHHHHHQRQTTTTKKNQTKNDNDKNDNRVSSHSHGKQDKDHNNLRRAMMIESWVEKQSATRTSTLSNSASSSSESLWSSSETESRPKPNPGPGPDMKQARSPQKPCNGFSKTKLRAMKLYGELKKVKQPISPGGRIATFLNSIFSSGNVKKAKMCNVGAADDVTTTAAASKPATTSRSGPVTISRPCLVKPQPCSRTTTTATDNNSVNDKRSVRFYPVSVILGEDSKPCGHKRVNKDDDDEEINDPCLMPSSDMRSFVSMKKSFRNDHHHDHDHDEADDEDDDDDDDESCSSSDLFEIDHLVGVGLRYREELPVYETTSLKTNQAIANGLIY